MILLHTLRGGIRSLRRSVNFLPGSRLPAAAARRWASRADATGEAAAHAGGVPILNAE